MQVYVNYPDPHFTMHRDPHCPEIRKNQKPGQRRVVVHMGTLGQVLSDFISSKYRFASNRTANDLWLEISLATPEQEKGVVYVIQALLGLRYTPFADAPVYEHGC